MHHHPHLASSVPPCRRGSAAVCAVSQQTRRLMEVAPKGCRPAARGADVSSVSFSFSHATTPTAAQHCTVRNPYYVWNTQRVPAGLGDRRHCPRYTLKHDHDGLHPTANRRVRCDMTSQEGVWTGILPTNKRRPRLCSGGGVWSPSSSKFEAVGELVASIREAPRLMLVLR